MKRGSTAVLEERLDVVLVAENHRQTTQLLGEREDLRLLWKDEQRHIVVLSLRLRPGPTIACAGELSGGKNNHIL